MAVRISVEGCVGKRESSAALSGGLDPFKAGAGCAAGRLAEVLAILLAAVVASSPVLAIGTLVASEEEASRRGRFHRAKHTVPIKQITKPMAITLPCD